MKNKTVDEMKAEIRAKGYQWVEHIFNNNLPECHIELTKSKDPCYFLDGNREMGWGRFSQIECWRKAYEKIVLER